MFVGACHDAERRSVRPFQLSSATKSKGKRTLAGLLILRPRSFVIQANEKFKGVGLVENWQNCCRLEALHSESAARDNIKRWQYLIGTNFKFHWVKWRGRDNHVVFSLHIVNYTKRNSPQNQKKYCTDECVLGAFKSDSACWLCFQKQKDCRLLGSEKRNVSKLCSPWTKGRLKYRISTSRYEDLVKLTRDLNTRRTSESRRSGNSRSESWRAETIVIGIEKRKWSDCLVMSKWLQIWGQGGLLTNRTVFVDFVGV